MAVAGSLIYDTKIDSKGFKDGLSKIGSLTKTTFSAVATGITAITGAITAGLVAGAKYNATIEQYATSFEVMTGSATKATEIVEKLKKLGAETPFEMTDLADTTQLLMNYSLTADDAISKMQMLGDISQGSAEKMNRIAMAYGQMSSAGKVQLEDIKQMIEAGFNPLQEISQSTGESMESLYDRISKGTISVDEITASMERSTSAGRKYFQSMEKQSKTVNGQLSTLKDNASQLLGALSEGFSGTLANEILPMLNEMTTSLQEAFSIGGIEAFSEKIGEVFAVLLTKFAEALPQIVEMGVTILQSLLSGIQNNLPQIMTSAVQVITTLVQGILQMLPQIVQMGVQIIVELIKGIAQQMPTLIPQMVDCIILIVETLIDNIDMLVDAGIELLLALTMGLIEALPRLIDKVPEIINKLFDAFMRNLPKIIDAGVQIIIMLIAGLVNSIPNLIGQIPNLVKMVFNAMTSGFQIMGQVGKGIVTGIWNGISNATSWIWSKISGWCDTIVRNIKNFFGIHSPSTLFRDEVGKMLPQGLAIGIEADTDKALKAIDKMDNSLMDKMSKSIEFSRSGIATSGINGTVNQIISAKSRENININNKLELDGEVVYENQKTVTSKKNLQYSFA